MVTATVNSLQRIEELRREAEQKASEAATFLAQFEEARAGEADILRQIGEVATQAAAAAINGDLSSYRGTNGVHAPAAMPRKKTAKKASTRKTAVEAPQPGTQGAKKTAKKKGAKKGTKKATKKATTRRKGSGGGPTVREIAWQAVNRPASEHAKALPNRDSSITGLRISEMREIVQKEGLYTGESPNLATMLQAEVTNLLKMGAVTRTDDDHRYHAVPNFKFPE